MDGISDKTDKNYKARTKPADMSGREEMVSFKGLTMHIKDDVIEGLGN